MALLLNTETGDLEIKVIRDANGLITSGFVIDETDYQNINLIYMANKGEFKEFPLLGVGAELYLKSVGRHAELRREIMVQAAAIGYTGATVSMQPDGTFEIDI